MKIFVSILVLWLMAFNFSNAQTNIMSNSSQNSTVYFAQCMLTIEFEDELRALETQLRVNPYISLARVDIPTKRIFLLTKNIDTFTDETFVSWLGEAATKSYCHQTGIYGLDTIAIYPFKNCN
jgi:hypothetical protein